MTDSNIHILNRDTLFKILANLDSKSVLNTCQINKQFARLCSDPNTFKRLMKLHYPQIPINKDPKKQYIEIAKGVITTYEGIFNEYYELSGFRLGYPLRGVPLRTIGKLDSETKVWVACRLEYVFSDEYDDILKWVDGSCLAFSNKEDALDYAYNLFLRDSEIAIENEIAAGEISREDAIVSLEITQGTKKEIKDLLLEEDHSSAPHYIFYDHLSDVNSNIYYKVFQTILP